MCTPSVSEHPLVFISGYANPENVFYCLYIIFPSECGCPKANPKNDAQKVVDFICDPVDGACRCPSTENGQYTKTENGCVLGGKCYNKRKLLKSVRIEIYDPLPKIIGYCYPGGSPVLHGNKFYNYDQNEDYANSLSVYDRCLEY